MDTIINETGTLKYVIKVNGIVVSIPFQSQTQAQNAITNLSESQQSIATVVPVTENGQEVLMG